jgi:hypothetical protein
MAGHNTNMVKMTMKPKKMKGKMAKRHVVEAADHGGYTSRTEFHQPPMDPGNPSYMPQSIPDETAVHPTMADAQDHMASQFGDDSE